MQMADKNEVSRRKELHLGFSRMSISRNLQLRRARLHVTIDITPQRKGGKRSVRRHDDSTNAFIIWRVIGSAPTICDKRE